ncbi:MAG: glycosyltransferase family 4 protein [Patescibacteria group bacterium]
MNRKIEAPRANSPRILCMINKHSSGLKAEIPACRFTRRNGGQAGADLSTEALAKGEKTSGPEGIPSGFSRRRTKRPKVLMVTPYLPYPPYSGGQTRSYHLLKHLSKKCEITLFNFVLPDQEEKYTNHLKKYCRKVITIERGKTWSLKKVLLTGLGPYPFLVINYYSSLLKKKIASEMESEKYDLVHVECFYLMPNIPKIGIPVLLVDQTIEFAVYQHFVETLSNKFRLIKPLLLIDVLKLKFWERFFWKRANRLIAVSKNDKVLMEKMSGRKADIVANGVDETLFTPKRVFKYRKPTILFGVANFKWMQNKEGVVNLIRFIWPKIKKRIPQAQLVIAGRHSKEFIESTGLVKNNDRSVIVGEVNRPSDIYRKSWVLVAPMKSGGGSRTKFFEAMACGLPIITTNQGIEGIEAKEGQEVLVGNTFEELTKLTVKILKNKQLREKIGQSGKKLVEKRYSWKESASQLLKIYQDTCSQ